MQCIQSNVHCVHMRRRLERCAACISYLAELDPLCKEGNVLMANG